MAGLDYGLLAIVALSAGIGLFRGLFREALSLGVWVAAIWAAAHHADWLLPYLGQWIDSPVLALWAARLAVLTGTLLLGGIAGWLLSMLLYRSRLGMPDRSAGMVFGLARGVLLAGVAVLALRVAGFDAEPWWQESKLLPYAVPVADILQDAAEREFGKPGQPAGPGLELPVPGRAGS